MAEVLRFASFLFHDARDGLSANFLHFFVINGSIQNFIQLGDVAVGVVQQILQVLVLLRVAKCSLRICYSRNNKQKKTT